MGRKIAYSLGSGFVRARNSSKGVLIFWFSMFVLVMVLIYPLRNSLNAGFGNSMITDQLADGFDIEVFADLGPAMNSILSFLTAGFIFVSLAGFLLNSFMTAGLFSCVRKSGLKFSAQEFFRAGAKNFWSFLVITLIITLIISILSAIIIGISILVKNLSESMSEKTCFIIMSASIILCLLILPVLLLTADYARAWRSSNENDSCFRAIGKGFGLTFSKFWSSYFMMIVLILVQVLPGILIIFLLPLWKPVTGGGVLLLLIVSQSMFYLRLHFKTWRYASVTSMMDGNREFVPLNNKLE